MVADADGRAEPVPLTEPRLGAHFGLATCFHHEDTNRFAKLTRPFGSLALLWCCQATQRVFSGFSCFVEQRSCQNFGVRGRAEFTTIGTFPLVAHVLKLEWDKAASYPACQV